MHFYFNFWQVNETRIMKAQARAVLAEMKKCCWRDCFRNQCLPSNVSLPGTMPDHFFGAAGLPSFLLFETLRSYRILDCLLLR